jgi:DNA-binding transcriptional MerR regulator
MPSAPTRDRDLFAEEVAARLEISVRTLSSRVRDGQAPPSRISHGRRVFDAAQFEVWLASRQNGGQA